MGHEIVYCYWCSGRILGADFDRGAAVLIGNHACCSACLPKVLASLPDNQRETIQSALSRVPGRNTPRGGTEISSTRTPRAVPTLPVEPSRPPSANLKIGIIAGGIVIVGLLGIVFLGGNEKKEPRTDAPIPPPPKPDVPDREKTARAAIQKARDSARSGIDIDLQIRLWEDAVGKSEKTPALEEAAQGRADALARRKDVYAQELAKLMDGVDAVVRDAEYKKAQDALASARKRHDSPDWSGPIDRKAEEVKLAEAGGAPFRQGSDEDGLICVEAEHYHKKVDIGDHAWTKVTAPPGYAGDGAMVALPNNNFGVTKDIETTSPKMDYRVLFAKAGKYYVWVRANGAGGNDDSLHVGLDGKLSKATNFGFTGNGKWNWSNKTMATGAGYLEVATPGLHTITIFMREDGSIIDRVALTLNPAWTPKDAGPPETSR